MGVGQGTQDGKLAVHLGLRLGNTVELAPPRAELFAYAAHLLANIAETVLSSVRSWSRRSRRSWPEARSRLPARASTTKAINPAMTTPVSVQIAASSVTP